MSPPRGRPDERGAASLLVVTALALLLVVGSALGVVAAMVRAQRVAQSAADLAALAGAQAHQRGSAACAVAARVAGAHAATLGSCEVSGDDVTVVVLVPGPAWLGQHGDLSGQARAGPTR